MGGGRSARLHAAADAAAGHPAAMRQADDAAMDEPLRHRGGGNAAHLHRGRQRSDDADRRRALLRGAHRAAGADVSLPADVVLHLLLSDRARDRRAGTALPGAVMAWTPDWTPELPLLRMREVHQKFGATPAIAGVSSDAL